MVANWTNITSFDSLPALANTTTNGSYWTGILFMLYVVSIISLMGWGFGTAILISSLIGLILATFLFFAGLVAQWVVIVFLSAFLVSIIFIIYSRKNQD